MAIAAQGKTQNFRVDDMTCEHCVRAVQDELCAIPDVHTVEVDLRVGAVSDVRVYATRQLAVADVRAAVEEAGYELVVS